VDWIERGGEYYLRLAMAIENNRELRLRCVDAKKKFLLLDTFIYSYRKKN